MIVSDVGRSAAFYSEILGLQQLRRPVRALVSGFVLVTVLDEACRTNDPACVRSDVDQQEEAPFAPKFRSTAV